MRNPFPRTDMVLAEFAALRGGYMTYDEAHQTNQAPFRAMLQRGWIDYHRGRGFFLTRAGQEAWDAFTSRSIARKHPELPLTKFFDAAAFGLAPPQKTRTRRKKARARAAA